MKLLPHSLFFSATALFLGVCSCFGADTAQYYELRDYTTQSTNQQQLLNDYWQSAGVPAYNRLGIQPIGVFTELQDSPTNHIYVLIPHESLDAFAGVPARLAADSIYQQASSNFMALTKANAAYVRIDTSLLIAFDGMKRLAPPPSSADKRPWIFELRCYQSPSEGKGLNKVQMFNSGEITLMQQVGLSPVFYGRALTGSQMPNLVYMLSGENMEEHNKHWQAFRDSSVWKKLSSDPQFQNNVSAIINRFLKRTSASQI